MVLVRGFYMMGSKMIPRTRVVVDVPRLRVDAFGPFFMTIILRSLMLGMAVERSVYESLLSTKHHMDKKKGLAGERSVSCMYWEHD
jgi:hypothetical protein